MKKSTQRLRISDNHRFIVREDGTPFFWLGDTAWHLFHRLTREETKEYLTNRAERGFNVVQAVALPECDGLRTENRYGSYPLLQNKLGEYDPATPDLTGAYSYWDHINYVIDLANDFGIYIALLPAWGDKFNIMWGKGPEIFNGENARIYGRWLGERYKDKSNIIWILGGDRPLQNEEHYEVIRQMAEGLRDGHKGNQLMTFHPPGNRSSSIFVHDEDWLSFNMVQSGHNHKEVYNYKLVNVDYQLTPIKPVLEGEPCYEEHTLSSKIEDGYYTDYEVRRAAYWGVFAGGFGHTYGHHAVWCMNTEPTEHIRVDWKEAITSKGSSHMQYVRNLIESRPFLDRVPDQGLIVDEFIDLDHVVATRGNNYAFIYTPTGKEVHVIMGRIAGEKVSASWYDPRTGKFTEIGDYVNQGIIPFYPPSSGYGNDWVLVMDQQL